MEDNRDFKSISAEILIEAGYNFLDSVYEYPDYMNPILNHPDIHDDDDYDLAVHTMYEVLRNWYDTYVIR